MQLSDQYLSPRLSNDIEGIRHYVGLGLCCVLLGDYLVNDL